MNITLTVYCECTNGGEQYADDYCYECDGKGEILTDEGRNFLRFLRKFMFEDIE